MKFVINEQSLETEHLSLLAGVTNVKVRPVSPFDPCVCEFIEAFSLALMKYKTYPDVISVAFWCRKHHLLQIKSEYSQFDKRLGRGLIFHITPSNVPVNFIFSYLFGLIAGNYNIVRIPSKPYAQVKILCEELEKLLADERFEQVKQMTAMISYEHDDCINAWMMQQCQGVVIWGGDQTIQKMQSYPKRPRCHQVVFADRYSFAVCQADAVLALTEQEMEQLAVHFYNDSYLMDQNGCSSPRLIIWMGKNKEAGKKRFWKAVEQKVKQEYEMASITIMDKYTKLCEDAITMEDVKEIVWDDASLYRMTIKNKSNIRHTLKGKAGYFYEYDAQDLTEIAEQIDEHFQTLTYFGIEKQEIMNWVCDNHLLGIDRIVPIGQAMDMQHKWDGYNLIDELSRVISVS